mmetsp:Transcript_48227/g.102996  ORF Transcript_48227/g.102996 Transcript_48227/m.102996 type:complete len:126 (-) Transcript_48227:140-517(-)|eukprot:CAMPEP_0183350020 /NCGR_PEP_ID=MMETSP0164_2-20130417/15793_1 /TAXON_ID=221442 /ORGANISM="Coccolithus pelagicus ssp braarudi, Strain PLY182g" /LENGTH=125 /DNA_ID=CAMNT_0025521861 /DNA_START=49 /DNA_END=426 /DNA_ORIENTATION=-
MAQFAVLRYKCVIDGNQPKGRGMEDVEPYAPYISKGLPDELIQRLVATYQHTCKSSHGSKQQRLDTNARSLEIDEWKHEDVPLYTMLNWIAASGWELKSSSVGSWTYERALEHYVFTRLPGHAHN